MKFMSDLFNKNDNAENANETQQNSNRPANENSGLRSEIQYGETINTYSNPYQYEYDTRQGNVQQQKVQGAQPETYSQPQYSQNAQSPNQYSHIPPQQEPLYNPYAYQSEMSYTYPPNTSQGFENTKKKREKKPLGKKKLAAMFMAACMAFSALFGFAGTYIANNIGGENPAAKKSTVIYQSIVNTSTQGGTPLSVTDVAAAVKPSVVEITTEVVSRNGFMGQLISTGAGSGVIITTDGYIVTNNHVIDGARAITVRLNDLTEYSATLVATDSKTDIAVIKIEAANLQPAVYGNSNSLLVGETAIAVGNPLGELGGTVTEGIISALDREISIDGETMSLLQTSAAINPGNSGGGLFNLEGELIGIVNAKSSGSDIEGLGFAIPIDTAKLVVEELIENGYVTGRVSAGFTLVDIQDAQTAMYYRVSKLGLYIRSSADPSFQSGDIITAVDGKTVSTLADLTGILADCKVGDTVQVTVSRSNSSLTLPLTLTEQKN